MSAFTPAEIEYLQGQQLGRLETVNASGEPHVVPTSFRYNAELDTIDIGGHNLSTSKNFRDVARTSWAAFVVDDVLPPWRGRGARSGGGLLRGWRGGRLGLRRRADTSSPEPDRRLGYRYRPLPPEQQGSRLTRVLGGAKQ